MHSLSAAEDAAVVKFRGATYDDAVEAAHQALGPRVKVIAADRIRRGGIGGFFATELGVEVSVALHDETVDQALERLVAATAEEESSRWFEQLTSMTHTAAASTAQVAPAPPAPDASVSATAPTMSELLSARATVGPDTLVSHVTVESPQAPGQSVVIPPQVVPVQIEVPGDLPPTSAATPTAAIHVPQPAAAARRRVLLPTRGHVDLAVTAAAELARLTSEQLSGRRIAVHVVVTSDDGRSVEANAIIEDPS